MTDHAPDIHPIRRRGKPGESPAAVNVARPHLGGGAFGAGSEIDITGPDTATGVWALDDVVVMQEWDLTVRGSAFYNDEYRKVDGVWKIAFTGYKRMYEEIQPRSNVTGLKLTASWWGTGGRSELSA